MIATLEPLSPLDRWRQRLGGHRQHRRHPRPLAALSYIANGPVTDGLVDIENLDIVILSDEQLSPGYCALRLSGYSGSRVPWGVRIGGAGQCRFRKDLRLQPILGASGYRLDLADEQLLTLALGLERSLARCACRHRRSRVREYVKLPKLWAAFHPADAANIIGDGPELAAYSQRTGKSPEEMMTHLRRTHLGLVLFPFTWVSHHWEQATAVFADLAQFPQRQVFRVRRFPDDLIGFQDAIEFDFRPISRDFKEIFV